MIGETSTITVNNDNKMTNIASTSQSLHIQNRSSSTSHAKGIGVLVSKVILAWDALVIWRHPVDDLVKAPVTEVVKEQAQNKTLCACSTWLNLETSRLNDIGVVLIVLRRRKLCLETSHLFYLVLSFKLVPDILNYTKYRYDEKVAFKL